MNEVERDLRDVAPLTEDLGEELDLLWHSTVAPELLELEERVRDNGYLRQLVRTPTGDVKDLIKQGSGSERRVASASPSVQRRTYPRRSSGSPAPSSPSRPAR